MKTWLLAIFVLGCSPVQHPTPAGLVVYYEPNEKRLSSQKAAELDARHAAVLECLPSESFCRTEPPTFSIEGHCDTFLDAGVRVRGRTWLNGTRRITLPGSLGAAAHEMVHYFACETDGNSPGKPYREKWLSKCGDAIDRDFRRRYPPELCSSEPGGQAK